MPTFKTASPTLSIVPPVTTVTLSAVTLSTVTLTVTFDKGTVYDGYVYCAALAEGTNVSSVNQIIQSAQTLYYLVGSTSVTFNIKALTASTGYDVYSYAQSTAGYGNSLTQVKASKLLITTLCCKTISFTNAPGSVYGDVDNKYTASSPASSYIFSYILSAAPRKTVTVTPIFKNLDYTSFSQLTVVPASKTYTSSAASLQGSFYVKGSALLAGNFYVTFQTSGANAGNYSSSISQFQLLSTASPVPAPKLISSQFSDAGNFAYIAFDSATDNGKMTANSWPCNNAFAFKGANTTTCSWLNSTFVKASFASFDGRDNFLEVGDAVTLLANVTKAQCSSNCDLNAYSVKTSVVTTISSNPVDPAPVLLVPSLISSCTNLTIDTTLSTGSGGRYWSSVDWKVDGVDNDGNIIYSYDVLDMLLSHGTNINQLITIPTSVLQEATYKITITLTNFLGQSSSTSASFQVSGNRNLPSLSIVGSSLLSVNPSQSVIVYANGQVSTCSESQTILYSWNVFILGGQTSGVTSISNDPKTLIIAAHTLTAGVVYQAQVTALVKVGETDNSASSLITIQVVNGPVVAAVKGGYNRAVFITSSLALDASSSTDSNLAATAAQRLSYQWTCTISSTANYGESCSSAFGSSSTTSSSVTLLGANVAYGVVYAFGVKVSTSDGRSDSKVVTVQNLVVPAVPTSGATAAPTYSGATTYISSSYTKFNADSQVTVFGYVEAAYPLTAQWTAKVGEADASFTSLTSRSKNFTTSEALSSISFPLAIPGGTFVAGSQVTFRIGANMQGVTSTALYAYSEILLTVNAPPSGGSLITTPMSGLALTTTFAMLAVGWVDDPSDYPLTYDFVYTLSNAVSTIKARSTSSSASSNFPAGLETNNFQLVAYGRAYDSLLAAANASITLTVRVATGAAATNVTAYLVDGIAAAAASGDSSATILVVNNVANTLNTLNCTGANVTTCASLNRASCDAVAHTCGSCLDGFYGLAGAANTMCFQQVVGEIGATCVIDSDCLLSQCTERVCTEPDLQCLFGSGTDMCSGNGLCEYTDVSGVSLETCKVSNTLCTATCVCSDSYGGADCSLTIDEVA
eukprot:gene47463-biopygen30106